MKSLLFIRLVPVLCASALLLTGCVSGNSRTQADYDRGQSDAVKELYWAKERAKQTNATNAPDRQDYLEIPVEEDPDAPINLTIQLATLPQQGSAYKAAFDNISLDATQLDPPAVPEPQSWALVLVGLMVLAPRLFRRHRASRGARPVFKLALAPIGLVLSALSVHATLVTVPNGSFESPTTPASSSTDDSIVPGWVFDTDNSFPFGTEAISSFFTSTDGASGNNFAFIENFDTVTKQTITSAASLATIAPLTTYTLSFAIGNVKGTDSALFGAPGNITLSLLANGVVLNTEEVRNGIVANGTWQDFTLAYTSPATGSVIGENLTIQLASLPQTAWGYKAAFDNVTLDASPVPASEPPALFMSVVALGALALCLIRRHQIR